MMEQPTRREFVALCVLSAGGLATLLGACVSLVTHPVPLADGRARVSLASFPELATPHGAIKIQPGQHPDPVYVLALGDGSYSAVSPICTHKQCTVDVQGARLVCPCHGSTYDRLGTVLRGPAEQALTRYRVAREGDELIIEITS